MPTATYDLIASSVLGSSASSVEFASIPSTYDTLILVCHTAGSNAETRLRFNSDTGSNYNIVFMSNDANTSTSGALVNQSTLHITQNAYATTAERSLAIAQLPAYSQSTYHKTVLARAGNTDIGVTATAGRWANTAAINTITISGGTYSAGSSFYLYGLVA